jgi:hypothetical protein
MTLDYQSAEATRRRPVDFVTGSLRLLAAYFVISICTLPFLNKLWAGDVPLLALIQVPKVLFAGWVRTDVVMRAMRGLGLSRGSFSPDHVVARPYALAIAYLVVLGIVFAPLWARRRRTPIRRRWAWIVVGAAAVDFAFTLWFAGRSGITVY